MKKISEKVVRIQAKPVAAVRALSDLDIRIKCFIGLGNGYDFPPLDYSGFIDLPGFFEFLSHVLCDESLYLTDFDFSSHLSKGERYRFTSEGFPVANFQVKFPGIDSVPFELGGFPLTEEDFDIFPGVDELAPLQAISEYSALKNCLQKPKLSSLERLKSALVMLRSGIMKKTLTVLYLILHRGR